MSSMHFPTSALRKTTQFERTQLFYPKQLSVFLGATNLLFTGLSYSYNNNDIQNLKERAERIERILTSTCVQVCHSYFKNGCD